MIKLDFNDGCLRVTDGKSKGFSVDVRFIEATYSGRRCFLSNWRTSKTFAAGDYSEYIVSLDDADPHPQFESAEEWHNYIQPLLAASKALVSGFTSIAKEEIRKAVDEIVDPATGEVSRITVDAVATVDPETLKPAIKEAVIQAVGDQLGITKVFEDDAAQDIQDIKDAIDTIDVDLTPVTDAIAGVATTIGAKGDAMTAPTVFGELANFRNEESTIIGNLHGKLGSYSESAGGRKVSTDFDEVKDQIGKPAEGTTEASGIYKALESIDVNPETIQTAAGAAIVSKGVATAANVTTAQSSIEGKVTTAQSAIEDKIDGLTIPTVEQIHNKVWDTADVTSHKVDLTGIATSDNVTTAQTSIEGKIGVPGVDGGAPATGLYKAIADKTFNITDEQAQQIADKVSAADLTVKVKEFTGTAATTINGLATEANATTNKAAIIAAINAIPEVDLSAVAKTSDVSGVKTVVDGIAADYAKKSNVTDAQTAVTTILNNSSYGLEKIKEAVGEVASSIDFESVTDAITAAKEAINTNTNTKVGTPAQADKLAEVKGDTGKILSAIGTYPSDRTIASDLAGLINDEENIKAAITTAQNNVLDGVNAKVWGDSTKYSDLAKESTLTGTKTAIIEDTEDIQAKIGTAADEKGANTVFGKIKAIETNVQLEPEDIQDIVDGVIGALGDDMKVTTKAFSDAAATDVTAIKTETNKIASVATDVTAIKANADAKASDIKAKTDLIGTAGSGQTVLGDLAAIKAKTDLVGTTEDTSANSTIFGKIAGVAGETSLIGKSDDGKTAATLFGKIADVKDAVSNIDLDGVHDIVWDDDDVETHKVAAESISATALAAIRAAIDKKPDGSKITVDAEATISDAQVAQIANTVKSAIGDAMEVTVKGYTTAGATALQTNVGTALTTYDAAKKSDVTTAQTSIEGKLDSTTNGLAAIKSDTASAKADAADIKSAVNNTTYGLNAIKTAVDGVASSIDLSTVAKDATVAKEATLTSTTSGLPSIKSSTDKIGTASTGKPSTLFGAIEGVSAAVDDVSTTLAGGVTLQSGDMVTNGVIKTNVTDSLSEYGADGVAKEATLGTAADAATASTIFGKIAAVKAVVDAISIPTDYATSAQATAIKAKTDLIGATTDVAGASTVFGLLKLLGGSTDAATVASVFGNLAKIYEYMGNFKKEVVISQADYDALATKDPNCKYYVF